MEKKVQKWQDLTEKAFIKFPEKKLTRVEMTKRYFSMFKKILISHSHWACYFMMVAYLISNGGYLLLVYPIMIYGYALLNQSRPGKLFWYTTLYYTQILLILTFIVQLDLWYYLTIFQQE
jgi:hypothetical protein